MLTEADLRLLTTLHSPTTITDLSEEAGYSSGYVSERVSHLEEYDLVATARRNRSKEVRVLHTPVLEAYRDLSTDHPHIDFPSLVSPSMLRVCWFLDTPTTVSTIESRLTLRRRRIYQLLDELQSRGLITKHNNQYVLTDDVDGLARFAQTVIEYDHQHRAETLLPAATVVWSAPHEALITSRDTSAATVHETFKDEADWQLTGLARFADYDLEFFTAGPPSYFYSEIRDTLTPSDLIAHTLLRDADTRNLSYCALLLIATDSQFDDLRSVASYYDIETTVDALLRFVETHGDTREEDIQLPDWTEMTSLATQYGVTV